MAFSFDGLDDGFASLSQVLDVALAASTIGGQLPLVGEDLAELASGLSDLKTFLANPGAALDVPFDADPTVQEVLFDNGGLRDKLHTALDGQGILKESTYSLVYPADPNAAQASDIRIVPVCNGALCLLSADATSIDEIRVEMELGEGTPATGEDLPIDLGLPGLPLSFKADTPAQAHAGWTLELGFGLSRDNGFFLLDNPVPGSGTPDTEPSGGPQELRVDLGIDLFGAPASKIRGTIGFIPLEATDNEPGGNPSGANLLVQVGLDGPGGCLAQPAPYNAGLASPYCTDRISGAQLLSGLPSQFLTNASIDGDVDIDIKVETGLGSGTIDKTLPSFATDFVLSWHFSTDSPDALPDPVIALQDIRVDAGELFKKTFDDVFGAVGDVLEPTQEVRDFLFTPIPVISDISEFFGQGTIAMIDMARAFGNVDTRLLKDINEVLDFITTVTTLGTAELVLVDELTIAPDEAMGPPKTPDQIGDLYPGETFTGIDLEGSIESALGSLSDEWDALGAAEGGDGEDFKYPVVEDPGCLVGLLLGNDCVVVEWRPDPLHVKASYPLSFGPFFGVLYVTFGGELEANGNFGGGVSTRGVRMLGERLLAGDTSLDAGAAGNVFFQSLYLVDLDASGKDVPEFEVTGRIKVGAKFDALIVAAGVDGGIEATFSLNLNDTPQADGRMYIDEIVEKIKTPICLFNISGKLSAFLEAWARFGVCPFCHTETWRLATVTLFEWTNQCEVQKPELAREVGAAGDRVVYLNVGVDKALRKAFTGPEHDNESYVVRQMSKDPDGNGEYKFTVSAFGYNQDYTGERVVITNSAEGDDSFLFQGGGSFTETVAVLLAVHRSGRRQARDRQRQLRQWLGQRHGRGQRRRRHHQRRRRHEQGLGRRAGHGGPRPAGQRPAQRRQGRRRAVRRPAQRPGRRRPRERQALRQRRCRQGARRSRHHRCAHRADRASGHPAVPRQERRDRRRCRQRHPQRRFGRRQDVRRREDLARAGRRRTRRRDRRGRSSGQRPDRGRRGRRRHLGRPWQRRGARRVHLVLGRGRQLR